MSTDLAALFAPNKTITIGGIEFQIREFIAAEFPMVAALGNRLTDLDLTGVGPLFETESERVFALIASVTGRPLADIKQLRMTILVELLGAIIEENLPFFVQALPAVIARVAEKINGSRQSNVSSAPATP